MDTTRRIRVLLHACGSGADLYRTLLALACQDVGAQRIEIALASRDPLLHGGPAATLLCKALGLGAVDVLDARGLTFGEAMNLAARDGDAKTLALVSEGARPHPQFLSRALAQLENRGGAQAAFCCQIPGGVDEVLFTRRRPFRPEQLVRRDAVGRLVLVQRTAWDILCGLRPELDYCLWDFWLRLGMQGGRIRQVPGLLSTGAIQRPLDPEHDGRAKAMLVAHTPGAFEPEVCRWALALLRGEAWARPFEPGRIPSPREVAGLFAGHQDAPRHVWPQTQRRSA